MSEVICTNCGEHWVNCDCWDIEDELNNGHQVLALRLQNGLVESKYLQPKGEINEKETNV